MKMMLLAGLIITLPAIAVLAWFILKGDPTIALPAFASFAVNSLPFVVAGLIIRSRIRKGDTIDAEH